ncbi:MAG: hypothetical protein LBN04_08335 [Oscillospiraceae bacterium]|nr:hypothetical protein [Oscillospiraceae bacterium]
MANKYSYYQLRMACQQGMIASLYTEPEDPDAFVAGYVEAVTPRHVLLWAITPWGQPDGWCLRRTEDILQVFMGDDYEVRLQMLLEMEGVTHAPLFAETPAPEQDLLRCVLQLAAERGQIISLITAEETYTGTLTQVDDLRASMIPLDFFGEPEGQRPLTLREVQIVTLDTQEEKMYQRLNRDRLKLL